MPLCIVLAVRQLLEAQFRLRYRCAISYKLFALVLPSPQAAPVSHQWQQVLETTLLQSTIAIAIAIAVYAL
jgi:hypothetical protein